MNADDIIQEVIFRLADIIIHGGNTPQKIVVSEKVYDCLMSITQLFIHCNKLLVHFYNFYNFLIFFA